MEIAGLPTFILASVLLTIAPGPDNIFVITLSIAHGRRAGIATALGLCSGLLAHTTAAALGVSALIYQSAVAFDLLKYAGLVYLLVLAWKSFIEERQTKTGASLHNTTWFALYQRGVLMNIINPKVGLFFLAFLPQFVDPLAGGHPAQQMVLLGLLFMIQAVVIFTGLAVFAGWIGRLLFGKPKVASYLKYAKAVIFVLLGLQIAAF